MISELQEEMLKISRKQKMEKNPKINLLMKKENIGMKYKGSIIQEVQMGAS